MKQERNYEQVLLKMTRQKGTISMLIAEIE
jgi:hypothetical protein